MDVNKVMQNRFKLIKKYQVLHFIVCID